MKEIRIGKIFIYDKYFGLSASILNDDKIFTTLLNPESLYELDMKNKKYFSGLELLGHKVKQNTFANVNVIVFDDHIPYGIEKIKDDEVNKIKKLYDKDFIMTLSGILLKAIKVHVFKDDCNMNLLNVTLNCNELDIIEDIKNVKVTY